MSKFTEECPKCGGVAWYETEWSQEAGYELHLKCLCGFLLAVYSEARGILRRPRTTNRLRLPEQGTILASCVTEFARNHPRPLSTAEIAKLINTSTEKVSRYMMVLRAKGIVLKDEDRKGQEGGSTWVLTDAAATKLNI